MLFLTTTRFIMAPFGRGGELKQLPQYGLAVVQDRRNLWIDCDRFVTQPIANPLRGN